MASREDKRTQRLQQLAEETGENFFISYGPEGAFKPLRSSSADNVDTEIDFKEGKVTFADGSTEKFGPSLRDIKHEYLQSLQFWADTHCRLGIVYTKAETRELRGFVRISGLAYNRLPPGTRFDKLIVRELAMPPVISLVASTLREAPMTTEQAPLFVNRFGSISTTVALFTDQTTTQEATGSDIVEWRTVVSRTISPAGTGKKVIHVSHVARHNFIIKNTHASNTLRYRVRYQHTEGQDFVSDDSIVGDGGATLAAGTKVTFQSTRIAHRMILQIIAATPGQTVTANCQYEGMNV